jgi:hypothetical protein
VNYGATMDRAMAGMQLTREISLNDLMRGGSDHLLRAMDSFDDNAQMDDTDEFNADALLMSPIFNDSAGKLQDSFSNEKDFGRFEDTHDSLLGRQDNTASMLPSAVDYHSEMAQRPTRPAIVRESRSVKLPSVTSSMQTMGMQMMNQGQVPVQSSFGDNYNASMPVPPHMVGANLNFRDSMPPSQVVNDSSYMEPQQSDMNDYNMQSYRSPVRRMPDQSFSNASSYSSSYRSEADSPAMGTPTSSMYQMSQRQMLTPSRTLPPKAQSYAGSHQFGGSQGNDLAFMRQQLEDLRNMEIRESMQSMQHNQGPPTNSPRAISQAMRMPVQRTASASASMSQSMQFEQGRNTFAGMPGGPPSFSGPGNNVSIASNSQSFKPPYNGLDGSQSGSSNVNEAMEKLCESMKRSARSRSLVKQYSSGTRGVSRHGSGQLYAMRQAAGRNMNSMDDNSSGRSAPIRRHSSAKHQMQHPVRGVYRHDSSQGPNGAHSLNFQIDGRNMGL